MAFVSRGQRKSDLSKPLYSVGPGTYQAQIQKQSKIPKAFVPFGTMQPRSKDITYKDLNSPGPGSYNIAENQTGQKIVVSSQTQDIKILEISRPNPVFKSGTQRFKVTKEDEITPGPGQYNFGKKEPSRQKMLSTNTNTTQKPKIIQHLININKYQSIPSIPSNIHAYGYNQNDNNQLQLNQPPIQVYKGEKQDKIGPGHYNATQKQKLKGTSLWSHAKQKRIQQVKPSNNVGPGSYQVKNLQSLYNYKPSVGFASKTVRTMDQRKGAIINQKQSKIQRINQDNSSSQSQVQSRVFSDKNAPSTKIDDSDDDEYQYVDETTPGPGSYLQISDVKKFKPNRQTAGFGVNTKRFGNSKPATTNNQIGPGSYNNVKSDFKKKKQKKINVPQQIDRFPQLLNKKKVQQPGPGSYEPRNTMEDKLIYKIQRGYRGQFGSTQIRSKQQEDQQTPGPADYDPKKVQDQKDALSVFKSNSKRKGIQNKNIVPAPGLYNTNMYDISNRVIKQEEEDPDLIIKKPGFGVGETRFKDAPKKQQQFEDDDIIKQIQEKHKEEKKKKMLKNSPAFRNNEVRFKDGKKDNPGPGSYYDGEEDHWNKRTYNILFADI